MSKHIHFKFNLNIYANYTVGNNVPHLRRPT